MFSLAQRLFNNQHVAELKVKQFDSDLPPTFNFNLDSDQNLTQVLTTIFVSHKNSNSLFNFSTFQVGLFYKIPYGSLCLKIMQIIIFLKV